MEDEILEALESTAPVSGDRGRIGDPKTSSDADVNLWRRSLLRFLNELDEDLTIGEVRRVLEDAQ